MEYALNNTTTALSSFGMEGSWFGIVIIVGFIAVILSLFVMALSSFEQYAKTKKWLIWIINTFRYFCLGILTLIIIALPSFVLYYFLNQASKGNVVPLKISLGLIGGYFLIALIGWLSKKFVFDRVKKFESKLEKIKQ